MTTTQREEMLHTGELLLDEARKAGIRVWIGETGSVLWVPKRSRYFNQKLHTCADVVKMALEVEK